MSYNFINSIAKQFAICGNKWNNFFNCKLQAELFPFTVNVAFIYQETVVYNFNYLNVVYKQWCSTSLYVTRCPVVLNKSYIFAVSMLKFLSFRVVILQDVACFLITSYLQFYWLMLGVYDRLFAANYGA